MNPEEAINQKDIDASLIKLFNCKIDKEEAKELFLLFIDHFNQFVSKTRYTNIFQKFLNTDNANVLKLEACVLNKIDDCFQKNEHHKVIDLFTCMIESILDNEHIQTKASEIFHNCNSSNSINYIKIAQNVKGFNNSNSNYNVLVDSRLNFYYEKVYINDIDQQTIKNEIQIFQTNFSNQFPSFIVHTNCNLIDNKIAIPYFPFSNLKAFINISQSKLSLIDKIVMIKEIAIAIDQLHEHYICHLNLNSSCIMIDNYKNAYIGSFVNDTCIEQNQTKLTSFYYYRHPDLVQNPRNLLISENYDVIQKNIQYDIYSFGVLIYEIITAISPESVFGNATRYERLVQLSNNYVSFLLNKVDKKYQCDEMEKIIIKCMKTNGNESYKNMKEMIADIDNLSIYQANKDEIEKRIFNSKFHRCRFKDLVINYYTGNEYSKELIHSLFTNFINPKSLNESFELSLDSNNDFISQILVFLNYKNLNIYKDNELIYYEDFFNSIIKDVFLSNINCNIDCYNQNKLMQLSIHANVYQKNLNLNDANKMLFLQCSTNVIPISSMSNFIKSMNFSDLALIWIYLIGKELLCIHSLNLYHGELSSKSIGIYYNSKTKTFVPSIIPFYYFYKSKENSSKSNNIFQINNIEKQQKKDVLNYIKTIQEIGSDKKLIPAEIFKMKSMNLIVYKLFNLIVHCSDVSVKNRFIDNIKFYRYSFFRITFRIINDIFIGLDESEKVHQTFEYYFVNNPKEGYLNLRKAIVDIFLFSNKKLSISNQNVDQLNIKQILIQIKENNDIIKEIFMQTKNKENIQNIQQPKTYHVDKTNQKVSHKYVSYSRNQIKLLIEKGEKILEKYVTRNIVITDLPYKTIKFLIRRYLYMLNSSFNYRISIKLLNNVMSKNFETNIRLNKIYSIVKQLQAEASIENGCIYLDVKKRII